MKIIRLSSENIKRLVAVEITPDGNLVEIRGRNGQGKTSILDSIDWALSGMTNIQSAPIRNGASTAKIELDLGTDGVVELKVTRKFARKEEGGFTTSIMVEDPNGARFPSPQKMIDAFMGALAFDPLAFKRMKPAEQLETLRRFVPGVDFDSIDRMNKTEYDKRTELNKRAKELRAQATGIVVMEARPRVDEGALTAELENVTKFNAAIETEKVKLDGKATAAQRSAATVNEKIRMVEGIKKTLEAAEAELSAAQEVNDRAMAELEKFPPLSKPLDAVKVREALNGARKVNREIDQNEAAITRQANLVVDAKETEAKAAALTKSMAVRTLEKEKAIAAAEMPIAGIGFGDGCVTLNGFPFDQASDAAQLIASVAIAAAMNPKLRVLRVREGSLLDTESKKLIAKFADEKDMQVWMEVVGEGGVGFVIEDGRVRQNEEQPALPGVAE